MKHEVLNARYHEREAEIVAQAGAPGAVTIATNMAGRGTDIKLGGNFDMRVEKEYPTRFLIKSAHIKLKRLKKNLLSQKKRSRKQVVFSLLEQSAMNHVVLIISCVGVQVVKVMRVHLFSSCRHKMI